MIDVKFRKEYDCMVREMKEDIHHLKLKIKEIVDALNLQTKCNCLDDVESLKDEVQKLSNSTEIQQLKKEIQQLKNSTELESLKKEVQQLKSKEVFQKKER